MYLTHLFHATLRTASYVALSIGLDPLAPAWHDLLFVKPPFDHPRVPHRRPQPLALSRAATHLDTGLSLTSTSPPRCIGFRPSRSFARFRQPFRNLCSPNEGRGILRTVLFVIDGINRESSSVSLKLFLFSGFLFFHGISFN